MTRLEERASSDTASIANHFDSICDVLRDLGYLENWTVTDKGHILSSIYHETDLLIAEAVTTGLFDDLEPAALASLVSCLTYEHRNPTPAPEPWLPSRDARARWRQLEQLSDTVGQAERHADVTETRRPDAGFAPVAHAWAAGETLEILLDSEPDMTAGDFVRNVKLLIDLLRQVAAVAPKAATRTRARQAADSIHRGVVALSGSVSLT